MWSHEGGDDMPELQIRLNGWQALVAVLVIGGLLGARAVTMKDKSGDPKLLRALETQIMCDYMPEETAKLKAAMEAGDRDRINAIANSVTSAKPVIESVRVSAPLMSFSSSQEVVVKVVYAMAEGDKIRDRKTLYILCIHGGLINTWSCLYPVTALRYYMNFL